MGRAAMTCICGEFTADLTAVRFCAAGHHRYWRGMKELVSVSSVIRSTWPVKKSFADAPADVLEHARERGVRVDTYFTEYLRSGRVTIAAGEWEEVVERTKAVVAWWQKTPPCGVTPQMILADSDVAGQADWVTEDGWIFDMKNVSALDPTYWIQIGAYAELYEAQHGKPAKGGALVHVAKARNAISVKYVEVDLAEATADWRLLRQTWAMVRRRVA